MWKKIRVAILLCILLVVAVNTWRDQNQDWSKPIVVLLHPVNADGRAATASYIQKLSLNELNGVQDYLQQNAQQYRGQPIAFYFKLGRELNELPPKVPQTGSMLDAILWSLKFRYYAWQQHERADGHPAVTLYLNYYDPKHIQKLKHSTALEKGRIGSVNLFANQKQSERNKVVLTHELLHAFGASDKYDIATTQPIDPIGYADPQQQPKFPQKRAELMGGYIPISATQSKMPEGLEQTVINELTAREVGWVKP